MAVDKNVLSSEYTMIANKWSDDIVTCWPCIEWDAAVVVGVFSAGCSVGMIGVLVQPIQNGADKDGVLLSTRICLSSNFQNTFPLKK